VAAGLAAVGSIQRALRAGGLRRVTNLAELRAALSGEPNPVVVADYASANPPVAELLAEVAHLAPVVVVAVVAEISLPAARELLAAGAADVVLHAHLDRLALAVEAARRRPALAAPPGVPGSALAAFAAALRSVPSREAMLPVILQQVQTLLGVTGVALLRYEPGSASLHVEAADGWLDLPGARWPAHSGLAGRVLASGQPLAAALAPGLPEHTGLAGLLGLTATAYAPLIVQGKTTGVLAIASRHPILPHQFDLLDALAGMVASALHRAALHEQTELRLQRLAALHAVDLAITTSFDLRVTLGIALDHLVSQTQVQAAAVLLLNSAANTLEVAAVSGMPTGLLPPAPARASQSLAGRVIAERRTLHLPDLSAAEPPVPAALQGYASYYGVPLAAKGRVYGVLELLSLSPLALESDWVEFVEAMAAQAAIAIDNATLFADLQRTNAELNLAYDATIEGWARLLEGRGIESQGHTQRVAELAVRVGRAAGLGDSELVHVRRGALLHDIGMLGVPETVLFKPGPLTAEDRARMQQHPEFGFDLLAPINHLRPALDIPYAHHERWDGAGYPRGLKGEVIPLAARLFAVVDVWDALGADRPFRPAWTRPRVRHYLREHAGSHFDPQAVSLLFQSLNGSQAA
jgi:GAF domain-containing protein